MLKKLLEIDPEVKVIASSGYINDPGIVEYQQFGFAGAIIKPYELNELGTLLHQAMASSKS